jgi:hypothetical protein
VEPTGGATRNDLVVPSSVGPLADVAQRRLSRMLERLDGSRALIIALAEDRPVPLVEHAFAGRLDAADHAALEQLKAGLDNLAGKRR